MLILVIDDEPDARAALETFLTVKEKHTVITAENAEQGLKMAISKDPDLVLLDIRLPDKDGIEVLKEMKELNKGIQIAMITGFKDAEKVIDAFRLGAMDCLLKPFNYDYLSSNILPRVKVKSR